MRHIICSITTVVSRHKPEKANQMQVQRWMSAENYHRILARTAHNIHHRRSRFYLFVASLEFTAALRKETLGSLTGLSSQDPSGVE